MMLFLTTPRSKIISRMLRKMRTTSQRKKIVIQKILKRKSGQENAGQVLKVIDYPKVFEASLVDRTRSAGKISDKGSRPFKEA